MNLFSQFKTYFNRIIPDRIHPICLPIDDNMRHKSFQRSTPFVAGWGAISESGRQSPVLLHVQVPVISNEQCEYQYDRIRMVQARHQFGKYVICAGHRFGGSDSCQGDSGGPLMLTVHENGKFPFYQIGGKKNSFEAKFEMNQSFNSFNHLI